MAELSKFAAVAFINGLDTTGATAPTSVGVSPRGPNGAKAGLVLVEVLDQNPSGVGDVIQSFLLGQGYTSGISGGGLIQYTIWQLPGFNYTGKTFLALFTDATHLN